MRVFTQLMMRKKIPSIYKVLDWIQSSGTQYIDTGIERNLSHTYRIVGSVNYPTDVTSRQLQGAQGSFYFGVVNGHWQIGQGSYTHTSYSAVANHLYNYNILFDTAQNKIFYQIDNITDEVSVNFANEPENAHICLFSLNNRTLPSACKNGRTQVYVDDVLAGDFVPVYRTTDYATGMYDMVTKQFFPNAGTGHFYRDIGLEIYGSPTISEDLVVSNTGGSSYLNLPNLSFPTSDNIKFQIKFKRISGATMQVLFRFQSDNRLAGQMSFNSSSNRWWFWWSGIDEGTTVGSFTETDTWFWVRVENETNGTVTLKISTTGAFAGEEVSLINSTRTDTRTIYNLLFCTSPDHSQYMNAVIDLKETWLMKNNEIIYDGGNV